VEIAGKATQGRRESTGFRETLEPDPPPLGIRVLAEAHHERASKEMREGHAAVRVLSERRSIDTLFLFGVASMQDGPTARVHLEEELASESRAREPQADSEVSVGGVRYAALSRGSIDDALGEWDWSYEVGGIPVLFIDGTRLCAATLMGRAIEPPGSWRVVDIAPYWEGRRTVLG
jgi:hypothetical protein